MSKKILLISLSLLLSTSLFAEDLNKIIEDRYDACVEADNTCLTKCEESEDFGTCADKCTETLDRCNEEVSKLETE